MNLVDTIVLGSFSTLGLICGLIAMGLPVYHMIVPDEFGVRMEKRYAVPLMLGGIVASSLNLSIMINELKWGF